jgi:hypothetical protein
MGASLGVLGGNDGEYAVVYNAVKFADESHLKLTSVTKNPGHLPPSVKFCESGHAIGGVSRPARF